MRWLSEAAHSNAKLTRWRHVIPKPQAHLLQLNPRDVSMPSTWLHPSDRTRTVSIFLWNKVRWYLNWIGENIGFLRYVAWTLLMPNGLKGNQVLPIILPRSRDNDSNREELVELGFIPENVTFINQSWLLQVFIATEVSSSNDRRILSSLLEEAAACRILSKQALRYLGLYFEWNISFPWS